MPFPDILQQHVLDYYRNKSMQQIYEYNIFPVVQDHNRILSKVQNPSGFVLM